MPYQKQIPENLIITDLPNYTDVDNPVQMLEAANRIVQNLELKGQVSDGYHTFDELYEFRKMYNAALFNEWAKAVTYVPTKVPIEKSVFGTEFSVEHVPHYKYDVHKSWKHYDGELCFGGGWFIVVAMLPTGQISNHYEARDWDLFKIPEAECAKYPFDGHTAQDVLERLKQL